MSSLLLLFLSVLIPIERSWSSLRARYFNLDIAQSLIILSALVYERDDQLVKEAGKIAEQEHISECERQHQV